MGRKRRNEVCLLLIVLLSLPFAVEAQTPDPYSEEVTIIAPYQPSVEDANKISFEPHFETPHIEKPSLTYDVHASRIPTSYMPGSLKPASITGEPLSKLYRNLIKGGVGNYWTSHFELYSGSLRHKKNRFSVGLKHHFSKGLVKDYGPSQYSYNNLDVKNTRTFKAHTLTLFAHYNREVHHNYGYLEKDYASSFEMDSLRQRFQLLNTGMLFKSHYSHKRKLAYYTGLNYRLWNSRFALTEHHLFLKTGFSYTSHFFDLLDKEVFGVDLRAASFNEVYGKVNHQGLISAYPYFTLGMKEYELKVGVGLHQLIASRNCFYVSPEFELQVQVIPDAMKLYAGVTGGVEKNTLAMLSARNPYISPELRPSFSTLPYKAFGGVKGKIGRHMDLLLGLDAGAMDHKPFFVNVPWQFDTVVIRDDAFEVVYDDVTWFHVHGSLSYHLGAVFEGRLFGDYYVYTLTRLEEPFHTPEIRAGLELKYTFREKIAGNLSLLYSGKQYTATLNPQTYSLLSSREIDPYVDVSMGVKYHITKPLSLFLNVNNILNNHYEVYHGFPVQGINFLLGASFAF
ncbi:MAG: hypothetical protein CSA95_02095 [Bacteroidetes bacterium]|nr:MAG: hypothetical protein CSA95_02095 [Bacteroidota bacterium]